MILRDLENGKNFRLKRDPTTLFTRITKSPLHSSKIIVMDITTSDYNNYRNTLHDQCEIITEEDWKMKTREEVLASIKQWPTTIDDVNAPDGWSWSHKGAVPLLICNTHPDQIITINDWHDDLYQFQPVAVPADPTSEPIKAHEFLERGAQHMRDRAVQRDASDGERSMRRAVEAFNAQEGTNLTEAQGWRFMIQLKYARAVNGIFVADDYEDMAAYAGLAGESAQ